MKNQYDLIIIGAGPSGLSAAINAASEGLSVVVCEANEYGGQARGSSLIENFAGFPHGVTGPDLATLFVKQAKKFGVEFLKPFRAISVIKENNIFSVIAESGLIVRGRTVLVSTGLAYRPLPIDGINKFVGFGVTYGSPSMNEDFDGKKVAIIGGANSAGQAASFLSNCNAEVSLIIRTGSVKDKMSSYLSERVSNCSHITVYNNAEVSGIYGSHDFLESISLIQDGLDKPKYLKVERLFILIGSKPDIDWLDAPKKDGQILAKSMEATPGIFVAGDVRYGSVKRIASAVGEGARVINEIHQYLNDNKIRVKNEMSIGSLT